MARFILRSLAAFAVLMPTAALSQRAPESSRAASRKTTIDFTEMAITGTLQGPGLLVIFAPPKTVFPTLVKVRTSFADALVRSTDAL